MTTDTVRGGTRVYACWTLKCARRKGAERSGLTLRMRTSVGAISTRDAECTHSRRRPFVSIACHLTINASSGALSADFAGGMGLSVELSLAKSLASMFGRLTFCIEL